MHGRIVITRRAKLCQLKFQNIWVIIVAKLLIEKKTRYSNPTKDLDTIPYLIDFQEIRESLRKIQNLVVDSLVSKQLPQSASTYAKIWDLLLPRK